ncbi:MAG: aminotransferase class V-fold PLP-dependent enzyme [Longimicrobiales bacterium]
MPSNRRTFVGRLAAAATALLAAPRRAWSDAPTAGPPGDATGAARRRAARWVRDGIPTPPPGPLPTGFWHELRHEFLIPADEAFFNTGTLGSSPRVVVDTVVDHMTHVERDVAHWDYQADHEQYFTGYFPETGLRGKIGALINADAGEVALTQNATFGMNFMANGLDLEPTDEVVLMEDAHPGGRCGWELKDARYGPTIRSVRVPPAPESPDEIIALYERATTPRTRVWMIPHLTSGTAVLFPVAEMCRRAREQGIVSVVDGAQTFGHLEIDVRAMGCDAFFTSPHKWGLAPVGTGFLYVRRAFMPHLWSTLASTHWDNRDDPGFRLMQYGTGNLSLLKGLEKAVDFHAAIGPARLQERIVGLGDRLREGLAEIDGVRILSPTHPAMRTATTIWGMDRRSAAGIQDALWDRASVRVRSVGQGVRQCCHVYTLEDDVDRTLETVRAMV